MKTNDLVCCLCGNIITDMGHNPWPLSKVEGDRCCDVCNATKVIPVRIKNILVSREVKK